MLRVEELLIGSVVYSAGSINNVVISVVWSCAG